MKKGTGLYPDKKTINLVFREKSKIRPSRSIPMALLVLALAAIFGRFAVAGRLDRVEDARTALTELQLEVAQLTELTADFDAVQEAYGRYATSWMTEEERAAADRLAALRLVEDELMGEARVERFSLTGNVLAVDLAGVTLEGTSRIVQRLSGLDGVEGVAVYTASTRMQAGESAEISMTITLGRTGGEGGGAS